VVVVQTALNADELRPLTVVLASTGGLHVCHVARPGSRGSLPVRGPGSVSADADLVVAVVESMGLSGIHLVGASYSAAVVLVLASRRPDLVSSVAAVEPPPYGTDATPDFRAASIGLIDLYAGMGSGPALDRVMGLIDGPDWRVGAEHLVPGSVAAMERDAADFFERDVPALLDWTFDDQAAARLACPVLLVGGSATSEWFDGMLTRLERVVGTTTRVVVPGAGHSVALTHAAQVASAVRDHVRSVSSHHRGSRGGADRS
jgi:pimeloyl-ACP methyl ester carboxylesterase